MDIIINARTDVVMNVMQLLTDYWYLEGEKDYDGQADVIMQLSNESDSSEEERQKFEDFLNSDREQFYD